MNSKYTSDETLPINILQNELREVITKAVSSFAKNKGYKVSSTHLCNTEVDVVHNGVVNMSVSAELLLIKDVERL